MCNSPELEEPALSKALSFNESPSCSQPTMFATPIVLDDIAQSEELRLSAVNKRKKTRQSFDSSKKRKVKQVRRLGACLRCRLYKEPVGMIRHSLGDTITRLV